MTAAYTKADALGVYYTLSDGELWLGGARHAMRLEERAFLIDDERIIPQLIVEWISGQNAEGAAEIRATGADTLRYTAPGSGTEGPEVTIADGAAVLLEDGDDASACIRVTRDSQFGGDDLGGIMELGVRPSALLATESSLINISVYGCFILRNDSDSAISSIALYLPEVAAQRTSTAGQLGASGAGTITVGSAFATGTPQQGFVQIRDGGSLREWVYYESRTSTTLTVTADGRGLFGTTLAAGAATDAINFVSGCRIGLKEAGADGSVQSRANMTTAPSGVDFYNRITAGTAQIAQLNPGKQYELWLHILLPKNGVASAAEPLSFTVRHTYAGTEFTRTIAAYYRRHTSEKYNLYEGDGGMPNFMASPAQVSSSLPSVYAVTPPGSGTSMRWFVTRRVSPFGLESLNTYPRKLLIDSVGADVAPTVTEPVDIEVLNLYDGKALVVARYHSVWDTDPADTWNIYLRTDGTDPNPATDTPVQVPFSAQVAATPYDWLNYTTPAMGYGQEIRVLVTVERSEDEEESANTAAVSLTIDTYPAGAPRLVYSGLDDHQVQPVFLDEVTYYDIETESVYAHLMPGISEFWMNADWVWRAVCHGEKFSLYMHPDWDLVGAVIGGTPVVGGDVVGGIEVVDGTTVYVIVDGVRVAKIDATAKQLTVNGGLQAGTTLDLKAETATAANGGSLYFQVYDAANGVWRSYMQVTDDGTLQINTDADLYSAEG